MSKYLFSDAKTGNTVVFEGHQLEVREQRGHCPECFFHDRICTGIACLACERKDLIPVYYKEIKKKKKDDNE